MTSWLAVLIDVVRYLWFFRAVEQWEQGVYYFFGKYWRTVGPGRWPLVPYFMDVRRVSVVRDVQSTALLNLTLRNGQTLCFAATIVFHVKDPAAALNNVEDYKANTIELVGAVIAEHLTDALPERTEPQYRDRFRRMVDSLLDAINMETQRFGVVVDALRFPNYVHGVRTYRLLTERATVLTGRFTPEEGV